MLAHFAVKGSANQGAIRLDMQQNRQYPLLAQRTLYFVAAIVEQKYNNPTVAVYRLPLHYMAEGEVKVIVSRAMSLENTSELHAAFGKPTIIPEHIAHPGAANIPSRGAPTSTYLDFWTMHPEPPLLPSIHMELDRIYNMTGPDVLPDTDGVDPITSLLVEDDMGKTLHHIFLQFLHDVISKVPVPMKDPLPFLILNMEQQANVRPALFQQPIIPFSNALFSVPLAQKWTDNFHRMFPDRHHTQKNKPRHYPNCLYHRA